MPGRPDRIFYAPPGLLDRDSFPVPSDEAHHLARVLRVSDHTAVRFVDGEGRVALVRVTNLAGGLTAEVLKRSVPVPPRCPELHLAIATNKGTDFDEILTRLAEVGVHTVHPFTAARSVLRGETGPARHERWKRMARAGMKIAGSAYLTRIEPVTTWEVVLSLPGHRRILCEAEGEPWTSSAGDQSILLLVGPEGGFTAGERNTARAAGFESRSLSKDNLRATTAAILAAGFVLAGVGAREAGKNPSDC